MTTEHKSQSRETVGSNVGLGHSSATSARYELAAIQMAYQRMMECPDSQAEVIAKHYAAHATLALQLLELIKHRRYIGADQNVEWAIAHCVEQIKRNHRHDFGLELEWANNQAQAHPPERDVER